MDKKLVKKLKGAEFDVSIFPASSVLSELIRACRKIIPEFRIHIYPHGFVIERQEEDDMEIQEIIEDAVAKLYLKLWNKK